MDEEPYQAPPRWWSPLLSPVWFRFWSRVRRRIRVKYHRLIDIEIRGLEHIQECLATNQGVLITPNHSSHADPFVLYWAAEKLGKPFYFMAAWQIFMRASWIRLLFLRQHGCFSVDRDGTDIRAFRQAVAILQKESYPLVIFPEGAIYHINTRITPFRDGPAAIALTASRHSERPVSCVPCGIRYEYIADPTEELLALMDQLEEQILWRPRRHLSLLRRIYDFAEAILGLKEQEYLGHAQAGRLPDRIRALAEFIIERLESRYGITDHPSSLPERVKQCRRHAIKLAEDSALCEQEHDAVRVELDDLFVVTQLFSYPGEYASAQPSIEEVAEMLDKFEEDVLRRPTATIRGTRRAVISFGKPIPVESCKSGKTHIHALTETLEQDVQALLDTLHQE